MHKTTLRNSSQWTQTRGRRSCRALPGAAALVLCFSALFLFSCDAETQRNDERAILIVPALKGEIFPANEDGARKGGVSLISADIQTLKPKFASLFVFAANGTLVGSPEAFFSQGEDVIEALNRIGVDALFLDARDFGFGRARLEELSRRAEFPFVGANIRDVSGHAPSWIVPYYFDAKSGLAIIGLAGPNVIIRNLEEHVSDLKLINEDQAVREALDLLKPLAPKRIGVVAVGHKTTGDEATRLSRIAALNEVDFVVQGDLEGSFAGLQSPSPKGKKLAWGVGILDEPADKARNLSLIRVPDPPRSLADMLYQLIPVDSTVVQPDESLRDFLYHIRSATDSVLDEHVGEAAADITHDDNRESAFGDLMVDLMREYAETEIAVINTGSLRDGFVKGAITVREVYRSLPFGGNMVIGKVKGSDLLAGLNRSVEYIGHSERGRGMLQVSGLSFRWDPARPEGSKVIGESVRIGGSPLDPTRYYSICTDRYVTTGGDGYKEFGNLIEVRTETQSSVNILIRMLGTRQMWLPPRLERFAPTQSS